MASTYTTSLKIQEIGNGEQSGVWGTTTNTNWTLIEQAVAGVQTITMSNSNYTLTNLNGVSDEARNMVLVVQGTNSAIYQVVAPLNQPKMYVISNQTTGGYAITIGAATGSVVTIPNGVTAQVYTDGTNFYSAQTGSAGNFNVNGTLTASGLTDAGNMSIGGTLAVTGTTTHTGAVALNGGGTSTTPTVGDNSTKIATTAFVATATGGLGTMSTQNANNVAITGGTITGVTLPAADITGVLGVANGGTGASSLSTNNVLLGNGTSAVQTVAPGASGNSLVSNGSTWVSGTPTIRGLGFGGETWHDVTGSRSQGVTYTNNYGYPISVSISFSTSNDQSWRFYVNGVQLGGITEHQDFNYAWVGGIVPPGSTYLFTGNYLSVWAELY